MVDRDFLNEVNLNIEKISVPEGALLRKPRHRYPSSLIRLLYTLVILGTLYFMATYGCESYTAMMKGTEHRSMKEINNDFKDWMERNRR